mgnify:CR=1 FL=1
MYPVKAGKLAIVATAATAKIAYLVAFGNGCFFSFTIFQILIITINKWCEYQSSDKQNDKQATRKRQGSDKQATTDIRTYKNNKEHKEEKEGAPPDYNPWDIEDTPEELEAWLNS